MVFTLGERAKLRVRLGDKDRTAMINQMECNVIAPSGKYQNWDVEKIDDALYISQPDSCCLDEVGWWACVIRLTTIDEHEYQTDFKFWVVNPRDYMDIGRR